MPTAVVLVVVALTGSRLISLTVQRHITVARLNAAGVAAAFAGRVEPRLQQLVELSARQSQSAAQSLAGEPAASIESLPLAGNTFLMSAEDTVLRSRPDAADTANGIASEWRSAQSSAPAGATVMLGPMRLGSNWLIAIRSPVAADTQVSSVAYAELNQLVADSHLSRLLDLGYDFELSQFVPRSDGARIFSSSSTEPLTDTVAARIRTAAAPAIPGSYLQVVVRPRAGWYPAPLLASDIALLAFLAWLLAFGTHDLSHALQRSRASLANARRRLRSTHRQLATEIQQRVTLQESFDHARFHDVFTGLPNRRYFMDQLDRALREVRTKHRERIAVIIIDISRFRLLNDMLGHTAGDELMVQAARRFEKSAANFEGIFARWGDDQFAALILDVASTDTSLNIAALLLNDLRTPIELRRHRLMVMAKAGVTCIDSGQQRAEDVVREADIALSAAKRQQNARMALYAPHMAGEAADLVSLEADLHIAMEKRELHMLFQPIVDLRTYKMVGAEALLRWRHPLEGMLAPERFLRIAEEGGLMVPITRWTILLAFRTAGDWLRRLPHNQPFFISINISATGLRDAGLGEFVASLLRETKLPPSLIKFELTEASLIGNVAAARESLDQLHAMGIQLMLDDFGTGYSSLNYLQLFPFDFVKIDRPFANRTGSDQANTGMMAAMVQIAESLKLTAIAEIVETEAAAKTLQEMGCNFGQGHYFSQPLEVESALQQLRNQEPFPAHEISATVEVPSLEDDDSPTLLLPVAAVHFPKEDEQVMPRGPTTITKPPAKRSAY